MKNNNNLCDIFTTFMIKSEQNQSKVRILTK